MDKNVALIAGITRSFTQFPLISGGMQIKKPYAFELDSETEEERFPIIPCQRPYHVENTSSRPITEVKQHRARLVLGWVTAWEHRVPLTHFPFLHFFTSF